MFRSRNRRGGFTLLELLVVVAIIGILAALLAVFIGGLTRKAKIERTRALLGRISTALQSYRERYLQYPPSSPFPFSNGAQNLHWFLVAPQFVKTGIDPTDPTKYTLEQCDPFLPNLVNSEVRGNPTPNANPWAAPPYSTALAQPIVDAWGYTLGYYCQQRGANVYGGLNHFSGMHADWTDNSANFDLWSGGPMAIADQPASGPPPTTMPTGDEVTNWSPRR